ncbi:MAG: HNH endonuclease [Herpetosiphonaceae bacterium]|nr:HNH endonuclease [Herpetosiphonaceae bacterium]
MEPDSRVLVLNASYEPLHIVPLHRAVKLLLLEKAELVEANEGHVRGLNCSVQRPSVIRLNRYVKLPQMQVPCTRRAVLQRDGYTCQYCGASPGAEALTLDHIVPRAHGGMTTWDNVVAACRSCNGYKANRVPQAANLTLRTTPRQPTRVGMLHATLHKHAVWHAYTYQ